MTELDYERSRRKWLKIANRNSLILPQEIECGNPQSKLMTSYVINIVKVRDISLASEFRQVIGAGFS